MTCVTSRNGVVRVTLEDIGEGECGEARPGEETLLRFYVQHRPFYGAEWEDVENGSFCTRISSSTSRMEQEQLCRLILSNVEEKVLGGESIKKICAALSHLKDA
jgi:hypothetical protein